MKVAYVLIAVGVLLVWAGGHLWFAIANTILVFCGLVLLVRVRRRREIEEAARQYGITRAPGESHAQLRERWQHFLIGRRS